MTSMYVAMSVLRELIGERWLETYIVYGAKKKNVLTLIEADPASETAGQLRLMDLAEMMYNLQPVPGFFDCLDRMREGEIEGVLAELNLGRMLYWHGIPLRYVERTGRQGDDYDMVFQFPNGMYRCADAKCKVNGRRFSAKSLENTLKKGRGQLPKDKPGVLFVKHPTVWLDEPDFVERLRDIAYDFLRTTERVVSVKYYVEPITLVDGFAHQRLGFKEFSKTKTQFGDDINWDLFKPGGDFTKPKKWQRLFNFPDGIPEA